MPTPEELKKIKEEVKDPGGRLPAVFDAIGDPNRCKIFKTLIKYQNLKVSELAEILDISIPAVSQHLKIMEQAHVLLKRKEKQTVYYYVNNKDLVINSIIIILKNHAGG